MMRAPHLIINFLLMHTLVGSIAFVPHQPPSRYMYDAGHRLRTKDSTPSHLTSFLARALPLAMTSDQAEDSDYAAFLDQKERREAIRKTYMFREADAVLIEAVVQSMEKIEIAKDEQVFAQGDASDGYFYVVATGTFDCIDEETSECKATLQSNNIFGELAPMFQAKRALSVVATSNKASVWRIPYDDVVAKSNLQAEEISQSMQNYSDYFDRRQRSIAFQKCKFLAPLEPNDFRGVVDAATLHNVTAGEILYEDGDAADCMYIIKHGSLEMYDSDDPTKVVKACNKLGDWCGIMGIFFSETNERLYSVRATKDSILWKVRRDDFYDSVKESSLASTYLQAYREEYVDKRFGLAELNAYLHLKSRPTKKPVSLHSTFAMVTMGFLLATFIPLFKPGIDHIGMPQIFNMYEVNPVTTQQLRVLGGLLTANAFVGLFRIPAKLSKLRRVVFEFSAWNTFLLYFIADSNLGAFTCNYTFDAFSVLGRILFAPILIKTALKGEELIRFAFTATKKDFKQVLGMRNQFAARIISLLMVFMMFLSATAAVPMLGTREGFFSHCAPFYQNVAPGLSLHGFVSVMIFATFATFFDTERFLGKLSVRSGNVLLALFFVLFFYDVTKVFAFFFGQWYGTELFTTAMAYYKQYYRVSKIIPIAIVGTLANVIYSLHQGGDRRDLRNEIGRLQ